MNFKEILKEKSRQEINIKGKKKKMKTHNNIEAYMIPRSQQFTLYDHIRNRGRARQSLIRTMSSGMFNYSNDRSPSRIWLQSGRLRRRRTNFIEKNKRRIKQIEESNRLQRAKEEKAKSQQMLRARKLRQNACPNPKSRYKLSLEKFRMMSTRKSGQ